MTNVNLTIYNPKATIDRIINNDDVGIFTAETWAKVFKKYVPKDLGTLSQSYDTTKPFLITYYQKYSYYQWNGISRSGKPLNYNREKNINATSHWEQRAYLEKKDEVADAITKYIGRK